MDVDENWFVITNTYNIMVDWPFGEEKLFKVAVDKRNVDVALVIFIIKVCRSKLRNIENA